MVPERPVPSDAGIRLFSVGSATLALFLCSPLGAGLMLAFNYLRLGRRGAAILTVLGSGAWIIAAVAYVEHRPDVPGVYARLILDLLPLVLTIALAWLLQGRIVREHRMRGGRVLHNGWMLLACLASWVLLAAGVALIVVGVEVIGVEP